jgi:hypothetical protein
MVIGWHTIEDVLSVSMGYRTKSLRLWGYVGLETADKENMIRGSIQCLCGREKRQMSHRMIGHGKVRGVFVYFVVQSATPKSEYHKFSKTRPFTLSTKPFMNSCTMTAGNNRIGCLFERLGCPTTKTEL